MPRYYVIGIDPGNTGAIAIMKFEDRPSGPVAVELSALINMPVTFGYDSQRRPHAAKIAKILEIARPRAICIERVHAMPAKRKGVGGARDTWRDPTNEWALAQGFGMILALAEVQVGLEDLLLPTPSAWKRSLGADSNKLKSVTMAHALNIPRVSTHLGHEEAEHDRAEAILLCEYWRRQGPHTLHRAS